MSALRIAVPGQPVRLVPIDDGATPKTTHRYWMTSLGGPVGPTAPVRPVAKKRKSRAKPRDGATT